MAINAIKTNKSVRTMSIVALFFITIVYLLPIANVLVAIIGQGDQFYWSEHALWLQLFIITGSIVFSLIFGILMYVFIIRTMRGIRSSVIFDRLNSKILLWCSVVYFLSEFFNTNLHVMLHLGATEGHGSLVLSSTMIVPALIIAIFALLYRLACDISEENRLTI